MKRSGSKFSLMAFHFHLNKFSGWSCALLFEGHFKGLQKSQQRQKHIKGKTQSNAQSVAVKFPGALGRRTYPPATWLEHSLFWTPVSDLFKIDGIPARTVSCYSVCLCGVFVRSHRAVLWLSSAGLRYSWCLHFKMQTMLTHNATD